MKSTARERWAGRKTFLQLYNRQRLSLNVVSVSTCRILFKPLMRVRTSGHDPITPSREIIPSKLREQEQNWIHLSTDAILFSVWNNAKSRHFTRTLLLSLEIHESPDGANPRVVAAPVDEALVLAGLQVVVTSPVVWLLVYEPVAVHHVAGVEVGDAITVHEVGAVVRQLHHLTSHVKMLVQPHPVAVTVLQRAGRSKITSQSQKRPIFHRILNLNVKDSD